MGVLGPNLTVHGEKMRPDLGFGKSICSPERVPFKLIREEERNECDEHRCAEPELHPFFFLSPDQPDGREQEAGTGLEVVEEEEGEEQGKVVGTGTGLIVCILPIIQPYTLFNTEGFTGGKGFCLPGQGAPTGLVCPGEVLLSTIFIFSPGSSGDIWSRRKGEQIFYCSLFHEAQIPEGGG